MEEAPKYSEFIPPESKDQENMIYPSNAKRSLSDVIFEDLEKPKRPLSIYNIFFQEERIRILEERGYATKDSVIEGQETQVQNDSKCNFSKEAIKKKRGRPRGKNYRKRKPHRMIGFQDLAKCISKRWQSKKKEYERLHGTMVEEKRQRYKEDMIAYKKKKQDILENLQTSETNSEVNRYDPFICQNEGKGKLTCSYEILHGREDNENSDLFFEIEPLNMFDKYGVWNECNALDIEKCTLDLQHHQHHNGYLSFPASNALCRDQSQMSVKKDSSYMDMTQSTRFANNEQFPIYVHPCNNSGPYRTNGQPSHNYDVSKHAATYHNLPPDYGTDSYHHSAMNGIHGGSMCYNSHGHFNQNQGPHLNQRSDNVPWYYKQHQSHYSTSVHSYSNTLPSKTCYVSQSKCFPWVENKNMQII